MTSSCWWPDQAGKITQSILNIDGLNHFTDPLDLTEDVKTGNLYIAEYGGQKITLARPIKGRREQAGVHPQGRVSRERFAACGFAKK